MYCCTKKDVFFDEESDGDIPGAWGGPNKPVIYRKNNKKWVYKKIQKSDFGHKSTPDVLPDPEDIYPGVLGHAESDFDSARAPK